jgi:hypothetical protein
VVENSKDYAQKPQRYLMFMNSASGQWMQDTGGQKCLACTKKTMGMEKQGRTGKSGMNKNRREQNRLVQ